MAGCWAGGGLQHWNKYQIVLNVPFSLCMHWHYTNGGTKQGSSGCIPPTHTSIYQSIHTRANSGRQRLVLNTFGLTWTFNTWSTALWRMPPLSSEGFTLIHHITSTWFTLNFSHTFYGCTKNCQNRPTRTIATVDLNTPPNQNCVIVDINWTH